jgi:1-deoxy-D-xylulose-5-phosphate synthase
MLNLPKVCAVRYPRGNGVGQKIDSTFSILPVGKGKIVHTGEKIAIFAFGSMVHPALTVANEINATVCDMRFVKPLDLDLITQMCATHDYIVTIEENVIMGGAGSACLEAMQLLGLNNPTLQLGIPDEFIEHGDPKLLLSQIGLDASGILSSIKSKHWL